MRDNLLFWDQDLFQVFEGNFAKAKRIVEEISADQISSSTDDEIVNHVFSRQEIVPLEIYEAEMEMDQSETKVDVSRDPMRTFFRDSQGPLYVPGLSITVSIPFSGDPYLWNCKPSTSTFSPPSAVVRSKGNEHQGYIDITITEPSDSIGDGTKVKNAIDKTVLDIKSWLEYIRNDVVAHNAALPGKIRQHVVARRERLASHGTALKALNIPLKKRNGAPDVSTLVLQKKIIRPLPAITKGLPQHAIRDEDYEYILKVIRHEGRSFESTPSTFAVHGEEELRDIILAHLNGHYEGQATGESFRKKGKTDIRIEFENRAAFVAECKLWGGAKQVGEAIDQLRGYLTWKDCKASFIVFNTSVAGFSDIQKKLPDAIKGHQGFVSELRSEHAGEWRFRFKAEDDEQRQITLHVFLFNLYVK